MSLFFELLQVSLGQRDGLSHVPSDDEWYALYDEAKRQAVEGIIFCGVEKILQDQCPPRQLLMQWISDVSVIEGRNARMNARCQELLHRFYGIGLRSTILKGQGLARLYGEDGKRRNCGDIDVFVAGGIEYALGKIPTKRVNGWDYKHADLHIWNDTEIEMHYHVEYTNNLIRNSRLQKWFLMHEEEFFHSDGVLVTPTLEMNLFYILLHIYRHFFYQGVGLRQIVDYYFVLKQICCQYPASNIQWPTDKIQAVSSFGMERFARGLMWVMGEVLAMPCEWMPWMPDEREGRFILAQVQAGGNFGNHAEGLAQVSNNREKMLRTLRHTLHLFRHYPAEAFSAPVWAVYNRVWRSVYWLKLKRHDNIPGK